MRVLLGIISILALTLHGFAAPENVTVTVADAFDFPVGKPVAQGYHKARGFTPGVHLGEDWDGDSGGDTDLGDPVSSIGNGVVVFAADVHLGWGNVVILRHTYFENGQLNTIDSLYGHLNEILVKPGDMVQRGQKIGTIGTAHGMYPAHLHFEIRKNLTIGMNRSAFAPDFTNYYDPTQFIAHHRILPGGPETNIIAVNTFAHPANSYGGPIGTRYAGYKASVDSDTGGDDGGSSQTVAFSLFAGDSPSKVQLKPKSGSKKTPFKISRYDDVPLLVK